MRRGGPVPSEASDYLLAERMGWTLDYIRSMDIDDRLCLGQVLDGLDTARYHEGRRARERAG